ncbi:MAG: hypothetical protein AAF696_36225, partial [Bacteroidota bacterium]
INSMRNIQTYLSAFLILFIVSACDKAEISSLSIKSTLEGELQSLTPGDSFELHIEARDVDGIDLVKIESPVLSLEVIHENIGKKKWKWTQQIEIRDNTPSGEIEIMVSMKDDTGEEYVTFSTLRVL